jgi:inositol-pentakisphosphate 2-kinase
LKSLFCPLDLVSESPDDLKTVSAKILASKKSPVPIDRLAEWLGTNRLLKQLCEHQKRLDPKGVLEENADNENLLAAMALRDCTIFIKFSSKNSWMAVEARLGDLDLKSQGKKAYWRKTEVSLIEEGWYEGQESEDKRQPLMCRLSPQR